MKRRKGWFRKAKIKWIKENVDSFEVHKSGIFGGDTYKHRNGYCGNFRYYYEEPNWYLDMIKEGNFVERFLFAQKLGKLENFYFSFTLKKNLKY